MKVVPRIRFHREPMRKPFAKKSCLFGNRRGTRHWRRILTKHTIVSVNEYASPENSWTFSNNKIHSFPCHSCFFLLGFCEDIPAKYVIWVKLTADKHFALKHLAASWLLLLGCCSGKSYGTGSIQESPATGPGKKFIVFLEPLCSLEIPCKSCSCKTRYLVIPRASVLWKKRTSVW